MNYYEILEVSVNASKEVIKNAYRALSKKYHPDSYTGDKEYAQKKMKEINVAYDTLIDDNKRLEYDYENGFKVNPNNIVESVDDSEQKVQNSNKNTQDKNYVDNKRNKSNKIIFVGLIIIVILFFIAFYLGGIIAGESKKPSKEENKTHIEKNNYDTKEKEQYNNLNDNIENKTVPIIQDKDEHVNIDEKEDNVINDITKDDEKELVNGES